ncbi:MAG TPA: MATE family efflux transporter [Candidatus Sphingobacterium stercoripullorum]|uniref:MATE family efflux transporter n=1 Tax=Candidatus Sphingobacterium stercoripullorum TaxID=2838759 RepID=A0A9D1W6X1_9SPHI|nr:MATE family efflux transporter [Candidatus Sphingobacterium stercoripullorum]
MQNTQMGKYSNYKEILKLSFPIILANASAPLLGLADTAAIGNTAGAAELGAIALASLIFSFVYWGFSFLRMATTGFVAQAVGANDKKLIHEVVYRSLAIGFAIGLLLILGQQLIGETAIRFMSAGDEVKGLIRSYFYTRIWGAPATLTTYALLGALVGMGLTKRLLYVQLLLNGLNIALNILFVVVFNWSVKGIALGTALAEWAAFIYALWLIFKSLEINWGEFIARRKEIFNKIEIVKSFKVNADIMIRTLALLSGFAWFADQGAKFGDDILAANHLLLQFVSLSAFFLDGYAHVVEMTAGQAFGKRNKTLFLQQVKDATMLAGLTAVVLAFLLFIGVKWTVPLLTQVKAVQEIAINFMPFASIYILLSFVAFLMDGAFIGLTRSKEMRNGTIIALIAFILSGTFLTVQYGNTGLWIAFILYVVVRGLALGLYFPRLIKSFE